MLALFLVFVGELSYASPSPIGDSDAAVETPPLLAGLRTYVLMVGAAIAAWPRQRPKVGAAIADWPRQMPKVGDAIAAWPRQMPKVGAAIAAWPHARPSLGHHSVFFQQPLGYGVGDAYLTVNVRTYVPEWETDTHQDVAITFGSRSEARSAFFKSSEARARPSSVRVRESSIERDSKDDRLRTQQRMRCRLMYTVT